MCRLENNVDCSFSCNRFSSESISLSIRLDNLDFLRLQPSLRTWKKLPIDFCLTRFVDESENNVAFAEGWYSSSCSFNFIISFSPLSSIVNLCFLKHQLNQIHNTLTYLTSLLGLALCILFLNLFAETGLLQSKLCLILVQFLNALNPTTLTCYHSCLSCSFSESVRP